ncbi:methyltransferase domain-containing protein [Azospirillum formosense]|uniref:Methyltransferase domain-containing protein n=1 Tax=Azospirillum formosense TaxID=861533 RepID=A0ABX2L5M9_9PROT|nr:methyltransferase domain-containing protein [Azospirillum formosense]NUB22232.1 methyltransferase domain-containing protein [Azospirillum formosense]
MPIKTVLNVGCGQRAISILGGSLPEEGWRELRLDIDPKVDPDIVASMTDMALVPDGSVDAVWSSHNLEHLDPQDVPVALREFLRVLKPGGMLLLTVPDLQAVAKLVAEDRLDEALYESRQGPIRPLDVVYGYGPALAAGNRFMAHRTGFTPNLLGRLLQETGFEPVAIWRRSQAYELQVKAFRPPAPAEALEELGAFLRSSAG